MNASTEAVGILREGRLFDCARKHLSSTGPPREMKYGLAIFFVVLVYALGIRWLS
jgi:hypothetical protein